MCRSFTISVSIRDSKKKVTRGFTIGTVYEGRIPV